MSTVADAMRREVELYIYTIYVYIYRINVLSVGVKCVSEMCWFLCAINYIRRYTHIHGAVVLVCIWYSSIVSEFGELNYTHTRSERFYCTHPHTHTPTHIIYREILLSNPSNAVLLNVNVNMCTGTDISVPLSLILTAKPTNKSVTYTFPFQTFGRVFITCSKFVFVSRNMHLNSGSLSMSHYLIPQSSHPPTRICADGWPTRMMNCPRCNRTRCRQRCASGSPRRSRVSWRLRARSRTRSRSSGRWRTPSGRASSSIGYTGGCRARRWCSFRPTLCECWR